jgi:hypothetical protein
MEGLQFSEEMLQHYLTLIEDVPMFMMSIDTENRLEKKKYLLPDNY